mgnify:FL=1
MKKFLLLFTFLFLLQTHLSFSQFQYPHQPADSTFWIFDRKPLATYSLVGYTVGTFYLQFQWWWKNNYHPFTIQYEGYFNDYALGVDKLGHFYTSYTYYLSVYNMMKWAGFDDNTAMWIGVGVPAFHAITAEIGDGFSRYQFSFDDLSFNTLGILYGMLQQRVPFFQNFNFKWSYYPSGKFPLWSERWHLTGDYNGHIYWLSMDVHNLLPKDWKSYWPKFLNLAVGYNATNISHDDIGIKERKFSISLDYNLLELPLDGETWWVLKDIVNRLHFPAPGIQKTGDGPWKVKPLLLN